MTGHTTWTLRLEHFRTLTKVEFSPDGVCLLAGPNGSGKTTLLRSLLFLSNMFQRGHEVVLRSAGGAHLLGLGAPADTPVHLELEVADVRWTLDLPLDARGLRSSYGERLEHAGQVKLRAAMFQEEWYLGTERRTHDELRCCAKVLWDKEEPDWMKPLDDLLRSVRLYFSYWINQVREAGRPGDPATYLNRSGRNLWQVLRTWKASPRHYGERFAWVINAMRAAFPNVVSDLEFDAEQTQPHGLLYRPGSDMALPAFLEADRVLTGFLHLTAVAGAKRGSVIAFDEMENQLHPHAIRSILASMHQRAEEQDLTIILTTHSPIVLNEFSGREDRVYVLESDHPGPLPVPLDQLHDEAWLSHFALGDLYEREQFGAPKPKPPDAS